MPAVDSRTIEVTVYQINISADKVLVKFNYDKEENFNTKDFYLQNPKDPLGPFVTLMAVALKDAAILQKKIQIQTSNEDGDPNAKDENGKPAPVYPTVAVVQF